MEWMKYYVIISVLVVIAAVLLILFIREYCRRKNQENKVRDEVQTLQRLQRDAGSIYEQLFPVQLLTLLGIKKVTDMTTDVQQAFKTSVMSVNVLDFSNAIHTMSSQQLFSTINEVFARIIPAITGSGGVIDNFQKAGLSALYTDNGENALTAAITMCESVDHLGTPEKYAGFSIGLCYGGVMLGIVGYRERISVVSMSESVSLAEFLQEKAVKYGSRILVTENFSQCIPGFEKNYNSRFLGFFYDHIREQAIRIFDVYDGDLPERKQSKRRTRMIFEQGVECFVHGDYTDARLHFVEVLKADRNDLAAREYLYICDKCCNSADMGDICIEKF